MKRKEREDELLPNGKKLSKTSLVDSFGESLLTSDTLDRYRAAYTSSEPYKHGVVHGLMNDELLRSVRKEIIEHVHFTPKETDIYKIHQSGDLANLSGLPDEALKKLPSLLQLRDALYSAEFRSWIGKVAGAGSLSGTKTDMAVNLYVPGCHLLCHDDVIGSRRVSYILYLTDPDRPWKAEWGGALRLYPTAVHHDDGRTVKVPSPEWSRSIPPAWNQLSFFAVQPGESFHDVEEVYEQLNGSDDGGRMRMAISGWFHIPQEGEDGFIAGEEARLAEQSSLQQLQGKSDFADLPQQRWLSPDEDVDQGVETLDDMMSDFSEAELDFLLQFINPTYLTPMTAEELSNLFQAESSLKLSMVLNDKFSKTLQDEIRGLDGGGETPNEWRTSQPPHKHRYQYLQPRADYRGRHLQDKQESSPLRSLLESLLPSMAFRKWLQGITGMHLQKVEVLARRFRRGMDYTLATSHDDDQPNLEFCLGLTPSKSWPEEATEDLEDDEDVIEATAEGVEKTTDALPEKEGLGGYEVYMAGDDEDDDEHKPDVENTNGTSTTGGGHRRQVHNPKADPAIYQSAGDDEDDGILFSTHPSWNSLSIVLRDKGTLKFVKYVSHSAPGDRWDICGTYEVEDSDDED